MLSVADLGDTLLKSSTSFAALGPQYPIATLLYFGLCVVAMRTENQRFHRSFVALNLIYQVSWMLRRYDF